MSVKFIPKGAKQKRNENIPDILQCHSTVQNSIVFHNISKPSPVLSDTSEFPSLNETSEKALVKSPGKILKYSDKLKSKPLSNNLDTISDDFNSRNNAIVTNSLNQHNDKIHTSKFLNRWNPTDGKSNFNKEVKNQNISQANVIKPRFISTNKVAINHGQNISKKPLSQSTKECNSLKKQLPHVHQKELLKQKHLDNSFKNSENYASNSVNVNLASNVLNKSVKLIEKKNELKEESTDGMQSNAKEKKKKKRKSKVKRQVALQSGKITVLTPEVHLKILSQTNAIATSNSSSVLTDINDEEEYPELGKPLIQTNQKGNHSKKNLFVEPSIEATNKPSESCTKDKIPVTKDKELQVCDTSEKPASEKKGKCDIKTIIHPKDPITISFYDILLNKNPKPNIIEAEKVIDVPDTVAVAKIKIKQDTSRPHNLLDSSSPIVKRGKEREKPKQKKPSQLKKIILLDRKIRKEQLLNLKTSDPLEKDTVGIELVNKLNTEDHEVDITENLPNGNNSSELGEIIDQTLLLASDSSDISSSQQEEIVDQTFILATADEDSLKDNLVPEMKQFSHSKPHSPEENNLSPTQNEDVKAREGSSPLNKICKNENNSNVVPSLVTEIVHPLNVSHSPGSLLNSLMNNVKKSEVSDKERAAKILLHTRNFREYCNHLISKDIDDAVFSLLDDLTRFQDRLHQKDPVKARMKRRMINGIKEVKKHIKLRKLKCIIIAVDIENVETQGGLNDILNDIKVSAADHHIPCVFALSRKVLGKVCHKPVPVSCVGVLNFEGSEVNFKKMVELQTQSKADYNEIFSKLFFKLTDEEASALLKAKTEAPETLRTIRTDILNDFFMKSKTGAIENESTDIKSNQMSDLIDIEA